MAAQLLLPEAWPYWIYVLIVLWALPWKGVAMWKAAKNKSKPWFVILFIVNTLGILEILYITIFSKEKIRKRK